MFLKVLKTLICAFSLGVCSLSFALNDELTQFRQSVEGAQSKEELLAALDAAPDSIAIESSVDIFGYRADINRGWQDWDDVKDWILADLRGYEIVLSEVDHGQVANAQETAKQILSAQVYTDSGISENRNWLGRISERMERLLSDLIDRLNLQSRAQMGDGMNLGYLEGIGNIIMVLAWTVLIAAVVLVLYFVFKNFSVGIRRKRAGGILDDDEPERTADEWLEQATDLQEAGDYRAAIRCLYLASLMRFDDANVSRFIRHETNWEHLYRFEASKKRPDGVDFRGLTQMFDIIWYGRDYATAEEFEEFRLQYLVIVDALKEMKAA